jgi:hypothetical protein
MYNTDKGPLKEHFDHDRYSIDSLRAYTNNLLLNYRLATSSALTYSSTWRMMIDFFLFYGLQNDDGALLPPTPDMLMLFIAWCTKRGVKSLPQYLAHIRTFLQQQGYDVKPFYDAQFNALLRAAKRFQKEHGLITRRPQRLPISVDILNRIRSNVDLTALPDLRFFTALCVGTFGIMRAGELTISEHGEPFNKHLHVTRGGCHISNNYAVINLPSSKTDRDGKGAKITLAHMPEHPLCPHCLLDQWLYTTAARSSPDDHLFAIKGKPYAKSQFATILRQQIVKIGLNPQHYTPHSMRIGGATLLAISGCSADQIMQLGRWTSACYAIYIQFTPLQRAELAARVAAAATLPAPAAPLPPEHASTWGQQMIATT